MSKIVASRMLVGDDELHFRDDDAQEKLKNLIVQEPGDAEDKVMSQKETTEQLGQLSEAIDSFMEHSGVEKIEPTAHEQFIDVKNGARDSGVSNFNKVLLDTIHPSTQGLSYTIVDCSEGDAFTIYGRGAEAGLLWAFVDSDNYVVNASASNAEEDGLVIVAPYGSTKLITHYYSGGALYRGYNIPQKIEKVNKSIEEEVVIDYNDAVSRYSYSTIHLFGEEYGNPALQYDPTNIGKNYKSCLNGLNECRLIKIPCDDLVSITYPTFVSTTNLGAAFIDGNDLILDGYVETVAAAEKTLTVPKNAKYLIVTIPQSMLSRTITFTCIRPIVKELYNQIKNYSVKKTKDIVEDTYEKILANYIYSNQGIQLGVTTLQEVQKYGSDGAVAYKIPVADIKRISYPVFKTSSNGISFFCDKDDTVIWYHAETQRNTNEHYVVKVPDNAAYFVLMISPILNGFDWTLLYSSLDYLEPDLDLGENPFNDTNRNMCLAGIKTDILTNKIPYHRGYLFHKLQNNDNSLWYGTDFRNIREIGIVSFDPTLMRFAISPKDGRIIAVQRDVRAGIWVWDGKTETHLSGFTTNPQAWLYNSGVDFIKDGETEYCIFAEYSSTVVSGYDLHVWRGKYPYTSASDWEIMFTQTQMSDITHFHMIRRDPWTNILYLTAGDSSAESKWWYSTDFGATWTLLISGAETGWGNSLCRTINFIFTKDYIYWATDHGESGANHHTLNRIARNSSTGVFDVTTKEQLAILPELYATNSLCYVESPNGLFMYDRIDVSSSAVFGKPIHMKFWDFATETLLDVASLTLTQDTWGGSRGKCYINYTNSKQPMPAMGFSIDTPCMFDLICDDPANIGTIAYEVGSKTVHTINY